MPKLTIFTATYNRAYILPKLYESLRNQTCCDFEWVLIDDGSSDESVSMIQQWLNSDSQFQINFIQLPHGGKIRAINYAVAVARGSYFLIVDSDDCLSTDAVEWIYSKIPEIEKKGEYAGFSGLKCKMDGSYIIEPKFEGKSFIDCLNTERRNYKLQADMAEIYKTEILRKFPFPVANDETFTPENVVWDAIALAGYLMRWHNKKMYYCEYLEDGLTKKWNDLRKKNPIGFAMSANTYLKYAQDVFQKLQLIGEILYCCFLKKKFSFLKRTAYPKLTYILLPAGFIYYLIRKWREC